MALATSHVNCWSSKRTLTGLFLLACSLAPAPGNSAELRADRIVVNKSRRELILFSAGRVLRSYKVALGRKPVGPKVQQGDGRTPEGAYVISGRNERSAYHRSLRVSYPNPQDIRRARKLRVDPGGDIMLHGLPNGRGFVGKAHRLYDWTEGCIAVTDGEIEEIWRLVPDGTPVQINP